MSIDVRQAFLINVKYVRVLRLSRGSTVHLAELQEDEIHILSDCEQHRVV